MIKFISKNAPADRRPVPLDPSTITTIAVLPGQILTQGAAPNRYAVKADGGGVIGAPLFAFVGSDRRDVQSSKKITVVDGPFVAEVNADCYVGTPALNEALIIDGGADVGKLVVQAVSTVAHLQGVVAYCSRVPDADGFIEIKVVR